MQTTQTRKNSFHVIYEILGITSVRIRLNIAICQRFPKKIIAKHDLTNYTINERIGAESVGQMKNALYSFNIKGVSFGPTGNELIILQVLSSCVINEKYHITHSDYTTL